MAGHGGVRRACLRCWRWLRAARRSGQRSPAPRLYCLPSLASLYGDISAGSGDAYAAAAFAGSRRVYMASIATFHSPYGNDLN
jgi:hypothetical protein